MFNGKESPWGQIDHTRAVIPGVKWVSTPSHGGLMVHEDRAAQLLTPDAVRVAYPGKFGLWVCFEEDCSYAVAFFEHPEWMRELDRASLEEWRRMLRDPVPFRARWVTEEGPGAVADLEAKISRTDDEIRAEQRAVVMRWNPEYFNLPANCEICGEQPTAHAAGCPVATDPRALVVIAAFGDWHAKVPAGMVGVVATPGGERGQGGERWFLVPQQEYRAARAFSPDPARHQEVQPLDAAHKEVA